VRRSDASTHTRPDLAVVVPTFNEVENVPIVVDKLDQALAGVGWEVIFVDDDSQDGTAACVRNLAARDPRVRIVHRIGRRGLSTACVEGILASSAEFIAVMDADLQHDETRLPVMLEALRSEPIDIVIGSRYVSGGSIGEWTATRVRMSNVATRVARLILPRDLADPMSGFFMIRRDAFDQLVRLLSGQGFKILFDFFASSPKPLRFKEIPYTFRPRERGESKLDTLVIWEFGVLLLDKLIGRAVPVRFVLFSLIGGLGVLIHLTTLRAVLAFDVTFWRAQSIATVVAMISNYTLNNFLTYRDQRRRGLSFVTGFLSFAAVCSFGAVANVGVAQFVYGHGGIWWVAGIAGAVVGAVWNYAVSSVFTWGSKPALSRA